MIESSARSQTLWAFQLAVLLAGEAQRWRSHVTFRHGQASVDAADLMALLRLGVPSGSPHRDRRRGA